MRGTNLLTHRRRLLARLSGCSFSAFIMLWPSPADTASVKSIAAAAPSDALGDVDDVATRPLGAVDDVENVVSVGRLAPSRM